MFFTSNLTWIKPNFFSRQLCEDKFTSNLTWKNKIYKICAKITGIFQILVIFTSKQEIFTSKIIHVKFHVKFSRQKLYFSRQNWRELRWDFDVKSLTWISLHSFFRCTLEGVVTFAQNLLRKGRLRKSFCAKDICAKR